MKRETKVNLNNFNGMVYRHVYDNIHSLLPTLVMEYISTIILWPS